MEEIKIQPYHLQGFKHLLFQFLGKSSEKAALQTLF